MQAKAQHQAMRVAKIQYKMAEKTLISADVFDEQAFVSLHASFQESFAQAALAKAKTKHSVLQVLTVEQREKWR